MSRDAWDAIGADQPYFGVITAEEFRGKTLTSETAQTFYDSGERYVGGVRSAFLQHFNAAPTGVALDVGCGVGRLTLAMAPHCEAVVGYDVAPSMVARARDAAAHSEHAARITVTNELPDGPFDWVMSYIVFQHIPREDGLALLDKVLARLKPNGFASLHFTTWRDGDLEPAQGLRGVMGRVWLMRQNARALRGEAATDTLIEMHDYDLQELTRRFVEAGCKQLVMRHTNHGGHHGVEILTRRSA